MTEPRRGHVAALQPPPRRPRSSRAAEIRIAAWDRDTASFCGKGTSPRGTGPRITATSGASGTTRSATRLQVGARTHWRTASMIGSSSSTTRTSGEERSFVPEVRHDPEEGRLGRECAHGVLSGLEEPDPTVARRVGHDHDGPARVDGAEEAGDGRRGAPRARSLRAHVLIERAEPEQGDTQRDARREREPRDPQSRHDRRAASIPEQERDDAPRHDPEQRDCGLQPLDQRRGPLAEVNAET